MGLVLRGTIVLAATIGLYVAADAAVGYFTAPPNTAVSNDSGNVPAFRRQPFISPDFLTEATREPGEWQLIFGDRLLAPPEFHGRYFNVDRLAPTDNLYRRTINPPVTRPKLTVLLLGPSTVYGPVVPDDQTLASLLSARLNELDPARSYVVYNAGVFAADSVQERDRLTYELDRGLKPDIVISFDGGMDIIDGVYQARPGAPGSFLGARRGLRGLLHRILPLNIYGWLLARASAAAGTNHTKQAPSHLLEPTRVAELTAATTALWYNNQLAMAEMSEAKGARFISILQPTPYSSPFDHPTPDIAYEHDLTNTYWPGLAAIAGGVQQALAKASAGLRQRGVEAIDLSAGLRGKTEDVFVDFGHLNAAGHRILAGEIAEAMLHLAAPLDIASGRNP
jgi:lysophospholipase L1-like esterase